MYTTAELFTMATDPAASREVFLNSVTLSIPDDADGMCPKDSPQAACGQG